MGDAGSSEARSGRGSNLVHGYKWLLLARQHLDASSGRDELRPRVDKMLLQVRVHARARARLRGSRRDSASGTRTSLLSVVTRCARGKLCDASPPD